MTLLLHLVRSVGAVNLLLAFVAFCLLCLWAGYGARGGVRADGILLRELLVDDGVDA